MATFRKRLGKWQVQVRRRGFTPATKSFEQLKDAERWATLRERELDLLVSQGLQGVPPCALTLAELLARYRRDILPTKRSADREAFMVRAFERLPLSARRADSLNVADFRQYRDHRLKSVAPATVCRELGVIQHAYEVARRDWGYSGLSNPVKDVPKPRLPRGRTRRLAPSEEAALRLAATTSRNKLLLPIMELALETSMRLGEIVSLEWQHVSLSHRIVTLPMTKNGKERTVPLSQAATGILQGLSPMPYGRVFCTTTEAVKRAWIRLTRRATINDLHFHDLRHEAISRLVERGFDLHEVMMFSGHTDHRMLLRYTHLSARKLVQKLDAA